MRTVRLLAVNLPRTIKDGSYVIKLGSEQILIKYPFVDELEQAVLHNSPNSVLVYNGFCLTYDEARELLKVLSPYAKRRESV